MESTINRRNLLRVVAVSGTAAVATAASGSPDGVEGADTEPGVVALVGTVESAGSAGLVLRTSAGTREVVAASGARIYSGATGEAADPSAFVVGDRVGARGRLAGDTLVATSIGSIFTSLRAQVTRVSADGAVAETTEGPILLTAGRLPYTSDPARQSGRAAGIAPGMVLDGLGWVHPGTGERYLLVRG
jgi:hypothetical protein